jgi:surface antigen
MLGVNDYPFGNCGCTGSNDPWGCELRQCTSFCAFRITHDLGYPGFRCWGDAAGWAIAARAHGFPVDHNPVRGAILQLDPGVNGASSAGHVAVVLGVNANGTVTVEDYNWCYPECCCYHQHSVRIAGSNFIHIGVPAPTPPTPPPPAPKPPVTVLTCPPGYTLAGGTCLPIGGTGSGIAPVILIGAVVGLGAIAVAKNPALKRTVTGWAQHTEEAVKGEAHKLELALHSSRHTG